MKTFKDFLSFILTAYYIYCFFGFWIIFCIEYSGWMITTTMPIIPICMFWYQIEYWLRNGDN